MTLKNNETKSPVRGSVAAQHLEKSVLDGRIPKALRELVLSELITSCTHSYWGWGVDD